MGSDDVEEAIREAMKEPTEITAEDLSPPVCTWCGEELPPDAKIVVWDIPEKDNESVVYRYRYCSENCKSEDQEAVIAPEECIEAHPHGSPEVLTEDDRELLTDGGRDVSEGEDPHTVDEAMQRFKEYDWLANCEKTEDGGWMMLYAPAVDPSEKIVEAFWDDMDHLMEASDLDHVTEIGNGWLVSKE